ncbi:hypothetical protein EVAR_68025_1 [Eumeta japonica]|uniref:Uncharacterized protein n=1 Tax=Eumeta variegata TaxID=151549 RepID=A0A4C1SU72_EUMVA|nr:hypothetical protein EVAR_68025_1 [Eumeta japonica]
MAVKRDHVDDFICSTDSVPEAAKLISDVTIVHARGLRYPGWATNAPELKESLSAESSAEAATVSLHKTKTERALEAMGTGMRQSRVRRHIQEASA